MTTRVVTLVGAACAAALVAACGSSPRATFANGVVDVPVRMHKRFGLFACTRIARPGDTIEVPPQGPVNINVTNDCGDRWDIRFDDKDGFFVPPAADSLSVGPKETKTLNLIAKPDLQPHRAHKVDIWFRGKNYDPKFEIDPSLRR